MIIKQPESERRTKVKVQHNYRLAHDGDVFVPGDTAEVTEAVAAHWIKSGWAKKLINSKDK
jgi:NADH dehydrogenase FAD-containing subunit